MIRNLFSWLRYLTLLDKIVVLVVMVLIAGSFTLPLQQVRGARVIASIDEKVVFTAPLDKDQTVNLEGPMGITVMRIEGGEVRVLSSPCPNQICVRMGKIHKDGDVLACVPNRVVIQVENNEQQSESGHDFISH